MMLKIKKIHILAVAIVLISTSCSEDDSKQSKDRVPIEVNASVSNMWGSFTRSSETLDDNVFSLPTSSNSSSAVCIVANNVKYKYSITGSTTINAPSTPPCFDYQSTSVQVYAWYPYNEGNTTFSIKTNQDDNESYCLSDLMVAQPENCTRTLTSSGVWAVTSAGLTFSHVMSKIGITIENNTGITVTGISLNNVKPTIPINTVSDGNGGVASISAGDATGNATSVTLWSGNSSASSITAYAVIPAQTFSGQLITVSTTGGNITYTLGTGGKIFAQNTIYSATLSIGYQDIEQSIDISEWGKSTGPLTVNTEASNTFGNVSASLSSDTQEYNASAFTPTPSVTYTMTGQSATALENNTHYTYKYTTSDGSTEIANPINAGDYYCIITGKGDYRGSIRLPFTITRRNILMHKSDFAWGTIKNQVYTGNPITPTPGITDNALSRTMVVGTSGSSTGDFYFSYTDNITGTANISITGINNYQGTVTNTFSIATTGMTLNKSTTTAYVYRGLTGVTDNVTFTFTAQQNISSHTVTSNNPAIASISTSVSGKVCTVTVTGVAVGNTTLSIDFSTDGWECTNYSYNVNVLKSLQLSGVPANQTSLVGCAATSNGYIYATGTDASNAGETVIGMICYVGAAGSADGSSSTYKGLIIGRTANSTSKDWAPDRTSSYSTTYAKRHVYASTMPNCLNDMYGIEYTNKMNSSTWGASYTDYAAAHAVFIGNSIVSAPVSSMTSKWFLPAIGQVIKSVNMTYTKLTGSGDVFPSDYTLVSQVKGTYLATINSALTAAGCEAMPAGDYWTSSECAETLAVNPDLLADYFMIDISGTTKTSNKKIVRPFLAF